MKTLLTVIILFAAAPLCCLADVTVHPVSCADSLTGYVAAYLEQDRTVPTDFFRVIPCYDNRLSKGIEYGFRTDSDGAEFTFHFPAGKRPKLLVCVPDDCPDVKGELIYVRAGVKNGDRKHGRIWNATGGMNTSLYFDFSSSSDFAQTTDVDGGNDELLFPEALAGGTVTFRVQISKDPTETYSCRALAASLDFSKAKGKGEISWDVLREYVREYPDCVSWSNDRCSRCTEKTIVIKYRSPEESWRKLAGREGLVRICPRCMRQLEFSVYKMN